MQISGYYNYTIAWDAEITWYLLFPCDPLCNLCASRIMKKGKNLNWVPKRRVRRTGCRWLWYSGWRRHPRKPRSGWRAQQS